MQLDTLHPLDIVAHMPGRHDQSSHGNNAPGRPPTRIRGYTEDSAYEGILADILEHVADVAWPTSVRTYQQMRTDAKLSALEDGYGLQLRRAQWQLDGTDCRPEVVAQVADDLGLPIKGRDQHGAARTRGVSWSEHLSAALTSLAYGHMGFEMQAEMAGGRARLVGLWERPQHTIAQIHVEPKTGQFTGISQEAAKGPFDTPELRADRLVWYTHRREGAQWFGRSLLRPAFAPWLLKREMQRVLATSSRRFGMGVPTVEWAPSATPTPEQFSEAQKAITASRVGDQAGATMPPGAMMKLVGLSGGTPDTLGFIKWLDQQMSTSALMGHLDLGQTQTGSRALGSVFVDSLMLALESVGEEIADVATRQAAARIVAWNWGADEPVPRVVVSGIGSRREVTAESLQMLLDSGALGNDPGLEEWVRREYRLPARAEPRPAAVPGADTSGAPESTSESAPAVQAAAPAPAPARPAIRYEQPELPITAQVDDEPDEPEQQDDEMRQAQEDSAAALLALLAAWPLLAGPLTAALTAGATAAVGAGTLGALSNLTVPDDVVDNIASAVTQTMVSLGATAADRARDNIGRQGAAVDMPTLDTAELRQHAEAATGLIVAGYRSAAARAALNAAGPGVDPDQVGQAVQQALDDLTETATTQQQGQRRGFVAGELDSALHTAVHWGRVAVFGGLDALGVPVTWWADESNEDRNRCRPCAEINGTEFPSLAAAIAAYPAGKHVGCLGRQRCRGHLRARIGAVTARVWNEADHPRDHRGRFRKLLSMDLAGDFDITGMSDRRLNNLFAEFVTEDPPNEAALLKVNAELERRERQTERDRNPLDDIDVTKLSEDELFDLWSRHRNREEVRGPVTAELAARRQRGRTDEPPPDWGQDTPDSPQQRRIDELVAGGADYRDAYAEVYDLSEQQLRGQERGTGSGRTRQEVRRAYRDFVTLQMLEAETDLQGHLLNPEARAKGIDPLSLFSGPAARARGWASEDLRRWWADHPRVTFGEFVEHATGSSRRRTPAETAVFATGEVVG